MNWQPGYDKCPGQCDIMCTRVCHMCGATPGQIGIGCLECECCFGYSSGSEDL
jgi:hypothetical protein